MTDQSVTTRTSSPDEALAILHDQFSYYNTASKPVEPKGRPAPGRTFWTRAA